MIVGPDFVVINLPKTGSTSVRAMLFEIDRRRHPGIIAEWKKKLGLRRPLFFQLLMPNERFPGRRRHVDPHGTVRQIPTAYRDLPVVMPVRNPFDRYYSQYCFSQWRIRHNPEQLARIKERFPRFPDLSFSDFILFSEFESTAFRLGDIRPRIDVGFQTLQFITMAALDLKGFLERFDEDFVRSGDFLNHLPRIRLLRTHHLNDDLFELLLEFGFEKEEIDFIRSHHRVLPKGYQQKVFRKRNTRDPREHWCAQYTPELFEFTISRERLLLEMFTQLGVPDMNEASMRAEYESYHRDLGGKDDGVQSEPEPGVISTQVDALAATQP